MFTSQRLATIPIDSYDLEPDFSTIEAHTTTDEYDAFAGGSWASHVLANNSGSDSDTTFRPHASTLTLTQLGRRVPGIMSFVTGHFNTDRLQWVRVFSLRDGTLAPHVDFLEFDEPGSRLQIPLRTTTEALHSENDIVYHMRRGEVWRIHTTDPHSARSGSGPARLLLCLDFAGSELIPGSIIRDDVPAEADIHIVSRPPLPECELEELLKYGEKMSLATMRTTFHQFAAVHFDRQAHAADTFDWFVRAAERTGDRQVVEKARAFRTYCIEKRAYRESFDW